MLHLGVQGTIQPASEYGEAKSYFLQCGFRADWLSFSYFDNQKTGHIVGRLTKLL